MTDRLRVGIAGYGVVGKRRRQVIDQHPNLETVAVCDRTLPDDGRFADGVRHFSRYERLLEEEFDLLFVCLTNDLAAEVTIAGLRRGCHVFCEKPPGRTVADIADVMRQERETPSLKLMYGFNHRYHESVRDALKIIASGELGEVVNLRGVYGKSKLINFESDWRTQRAVAGGGILLDQGIHMVDLLRLFGGDYTEIHSVISNDFWNHDVEDNAYVLMRTEGGIVAMLHSTATEWRHRFRLEISLSRGGIVLSGILSGSKSYGAETMTTVWASDHDQGDPREQTTRYNTDPSWTDEINDFAAAVLAGRPITNGSSSEAFQTMELVYRIYCADRRWKERWGLTHESE